MANNDPKQASRGDVQMYVAKTVIAVPNPQHDRADEFSARCVHVQPGDVVELGSVEAESYLKRGAVAIFR